MFPSLEDTDEKLVRELVEGKRSRSQAQRVLQELSGACKEASVELEVLLQVRAVLTRLPVLISKATDWFTAHPLFFLGANGGAWSMLVSTMHA